MLDWPFQFILYRRFSSSRFHLRCNYILITRNPLNYQIWNSYGWISSDDHPSKLKLNNSRICQKRNPSTLRNGSDKFNCNVKVKMWKFVAWKMFRLNQSSSHVEFLWFFLLMMLVKNAHRGLRKAKLQLASTNSSLHLVFVS